jgi:hypothetical protein
MLPRYYSRLDSAEYIRFLASLVREKFGLFAGLDFERFYQDLLEVDAAHARELRDLARQLEDQ